MSKDPKTKVILCSSLEYDSFDANTSGVSGEQFLAEIKAYNDSALFSSEYLRPVSQENRHIHWLLKRLDKLENEV